MTDKQRDALLDEMHKLYTGIRRAISDIECGEIEDAHDVLSDLIKKESE